MKKVILISIVAFMMVFVFASCSSSDNKENTTVVDTASVAKTNVAKGVIVNPKTEKEIPQGEYLSVVDTSKIITFSDYDKVKMSLFRQYDDFKMSEFRKYDATKMKAFRDYMAKEDSAIMVIRDLHKDIYLKWLDAKETNNYTEQNKIENSPEFIGFRQVQKYYALYQKTDADAYTLYQKRESEAYKEYQKKEDFAYKVYQSRK